MGPRSLSRPLVLLAVALLLARAGQISGSAPPVQPAAARAGVAAAFPIGVFEDGHIVGGDRASFAAMLADLRARGLDSVMFTNNDIARDAPLLEVADQLGVGVFMLPANDWNQTWWPEQVPATIAQARQAAAPAVAAFAGHPSFAGYIVRDEPGLQDRDKLVLLTEALRELDPDHLATAILIGLDRVGPILDAAGFEVLLIDVYPVATANPPCDLTMSGYGYYWHDFVSYIRAVSADRPPSTALWVVLQTHAFGTWLRAPLPSELRMQQWLALGEGARGIFWFIYSSQQGWVGLADSAELYAEVTDLARRLGPLRPVLLDAERAADQFMVTGAGQPYVSTLRSADGARTFVLAVNRDCLQAQPLTISSPTVVGGLRDLESGQIYRQGAPIAFRPGDGRIFQVVGQLFLPLAAVSGS